VTGVRSADRTVPPHWQVVAELQRWRPQDRVLGPAEGIFGVSWKMVCSKLGPRDLDRACKAAGVARFTPYGLRRAAVDAFRRAGVDAKTAATFTGHSVLVMLQEYAQASDEDRVNALARTQLGMIDSAAGSVIDGPWSAASE
jgi:integrase